MVPRGKTIMSGSSQPLLLPLPEEEYVFSAFQSQRDCVLQPRGLRANEPPCEKHAEVVASSILKGWKSLSPGLRGTSYPGGLELR